IWLAVVVVSSVSYASYLIQKFIFPDAGILITSLLGGLYSSTATTVVLARKGREEPALNISPAILLATTMMFVRLMLLAFFFNKEAGWALLPRMTALTVLSLIAAGILIQFGKAKGQLRGQASLTRNPLEFRSALIFAALFVFSVVATAYVTRVYGNKGFTIFSFLVGITDIDPFVITLLQNVTMNPAFIAFAVLCATTGNNLLKMIYSLVLVGNRARIELAISFSVLIAAGVIVAFFFWAPAG
ncbi:MAG: DUF4010 domain-containing protein, partial [Leptospirales bacterium]|nr:DUF4010 domain-containing protein [Leptospirales bacterium]